MIALGIVGSFFYYVTYNNTGDGSPTCYWNDVWIGDVVLKILFFDLFLIALDKEALSALYRDGVGSYILNTGFGSAVDNWEFWECRLKTEC